MDKINIRNLSLVTSVYFLELCGTRQSVYAIMTFKRQARVRPPLSMISVIKQYINWKTPAIALKTAIFESYFLQSYTYFGLYSVVGIIHTGHGELKFSVNSLSPTELMQQSLIDGTFVIVGDLNILANTLFDRLNVFLSFLEMYICLSIWIWGLFYGT